MKNFQIPLSQALFVTFFLSSFLNYIVFKYSKNIILNKNKEQKRLSNNSISPFGGIACSLAFLLSTRLIGKAEESFMLIGIFAVIISILGIIDDIYNLKWFLKLIPQIFIVSYPIYKLEIFINLESFFGLDLNNYLNLASSTLWIILIINSINFIDNMDGLAVVVSGSICLQIAFLSNYLNQYKLTDISLLLFVTIMGFFIFNYPPAKLYLGDSGSLFIGYCLGFISILFNWNPQIETIYSSPFSPILLFFIIPLLDFLTVISYRIKEGISPTTGGTDHISHRLLAAKFSERNVLNIFLLYSISFFVLILISINGSTMFSYGSVGILFLLFAFTYIKIRNMKILN